jgi:transposase
MNNKLHAVTDAEGRPLRFFMTAGQVGDYIGAAALLGSLPKAELLLADRGYDADLFREALKKRDKVLYARQKVLRQTHQA